MSKTESIFKTESMSEFKTVGYLMAVYCFVGTTMTLVNKIAIQAFPAPNMLLVLQNGLTVLMFKILTISYPERFGELPQLTIPVFWTWIPLTLLFVGQLLSSLLALQHVSVVEFIVARNLTTLTVAFFEWMVMGTRISTLSVFALLGILGGATLYGFHDLGFALVGFSWLMVNVVFQTAFQIYVKRLSSLQSTEGANALGPFGMSYYNNVISLPVLMLVSTASGEIPKISQIVNSMDLFKFLFVCLSGILGFCISTSFFLLNSLASATSIMVANNVNKFVGIILSELFLERTLGVMSGLGTVLVLVFGWLYAESRGTCANGALDSACTRVGSTRLITIFALIPICVLASISSAGYFARGLVLPNFTFHTGLETLNLTLNRHALQTGLGPTGTINLGFSLISV